MSVGAVTDGKERSTYRLTFGVKKIDVRPGGVILLNGKRLNVRGASVMEDDIREGGALSARTRGLLINRLKNLGATITRSQYPHAPGVPRGARPGRDHVLGRRAGLPDPEQPLGTPGGALARRRGRPR